MFSVLLGHAISQQHLLTTLLITCIVITCVLCLGRGPAGAAVCRGGGSLKRSSGIRRRAKNNDNVLISSLEEEEKGGYSRPQEMVERNGVSMAPGRLPAL